MFRPVGGLGVSLSIPRIFILLCVWLCSVYGYLAAMLRVKPGPAMPRVLTRGGMFCVLLYTVLYYGGFLISSP